MQQLGDMRLEVQRAHSRYGRDYSVRTQIPGRESHIMSARARVCVCVCVVEGGAYDIRLGRYPCPLRSRMPMQHTRGRATLILMKLAQSKFANNVCYTRDLVSLSFK